MSNLPDSTLFKTSTIADGNMSFRFGEQDEVVRNRQRFLSENAADYGDCVCMACNHGPIITAINRGNYGTNFGATSPEAMLESEVLVTNEPGVILMLLTADCLPAAFYDPVQNVIALAHLNRKTIAHDLGQKTVGFLTEHFNTNPTDLLVAVGPHIKKESYRFKLPLDKPVPQQLHHHTAESNGLISIDLPAAEIAQLTAIGVQKENILISDINTATSPDHFSHYRSTHDDSNPHGRIATILMLRA